MTSNYPALALRFDVSIDGVNVATFTGCHGLGASFEILDWKEGGDNGTVVRLPGRVSYPNVTLTRAVDAQSGALAAWFSAQAAKPQRANIAIKLYDANYGSKAPIASWQLHDALPVQYSGPTLTTTDEGAVAVESLELTYNGYTQ